jgi:hypothetical protein
MRTDIATECEDRVEVHLDDLVEVRVGELVGRVTTLDAGTGDEDGDLVAIGEDVGDNLCNGGLVCEVGCVDPDFTAELLDGFFRGCGFEVTL